jgi:hypothetical protein
LVTYSISILARGVIININGLGYSIIDEKQTIKNRGAGRVYQVVVTPIVACARNVISTNGSTAAIRWDYSGYV